jgi:hypothetical protein
VIGASGHAHVATGEALRLGSGHGCTAALRCSSFRRSILSQ